MFKEVSFDWLHLVLIIIIVLLLIWEFCAKSILKKKNTTDQILTQGGAINIDLAKKICYEAIKPYANELSMELKTNDQYLNLLYKLLYIKDLKDLVNTDDEDTSASSNLESYYDMLCNYIAGECSIEDLADVEAVLEDDLDENIDPWVKPLIKEVHDKLRNPEKYRNVLDFLKQIDKYTIRFYGKIYKYLKDNNMLGFITYISEVRKTLSEVYALRNTNIRDPKVRNVSMKYSYD